MTNLFHMLLALLILMATNILLGLYARIGVEHISFDWKKLVAGTIKALIIGIATIALAYTATIVDLTSVGVTAETLVTAAIILYAGKATTNLAKCLQVDTTVNSSQK